MNDLKRAFPLIAAPGCCSTWCYCVSSGGEIRLRGFHSFAKTVSAGFQQITTEFVKYFCYCQVISKLFYELTDVRAAANQPDSPGKKVPLGHIETEILEYFQRHPRAGDTIEGIHQWWLKNGMSKYSEEAVRQALDNLEVAGMVFVDVSGKRKQYRIAFSRKN